MLHILFMISVLLLFIVLNVHVYFKYKNEYISFKTLKESNYKFIAILSLIVLVVVSYSNRESSYFAIGLLIIKCVDILLFINKKSNIDKKD